MFFYCALLRPFSTCCAPFSAIDAKNIFNVILKTPIYCAPCALAPFLFSEIKKPDTLIRLCEHGYRLKRRFIFIEKVTHFCFRHSVI